ncbi:MAG: hypothetical protein ACI86C_000798 [Candidatus Latescibacterota bacterium]|jgi:hypothetical protein
MRKLVLLATLFAIPLVTFAQDIAPEAPKQGWTKAGNISLLFSQASFSDEWKGGGTSNIAGNLTGSFDMNYRQGRLTWDNRIMADYGLTKLKDQEFSRKTNDRLELNSLVGRQTGGGNSWYYSYFMNFKTQFTSGYEFSEDTNGDEVRTETTKFLSPGYLQTGPGMLWKKSDDLKVNIAPATARLIFVSDVFTNVGNVQTAIDAFNAAGGYFGVEANKTTRFEFGASLGAYYKIKVVKNVILENILTLYSNYLEDPQNVDIDYTLNLIMTINKFITANVAFQAIYDDNAAQATQVREAIGVGVTYGF